MGRREALRRRMNAVGSAVRLVERELKSPTRKRPDLWRSGFLSESAVLYGEDRADYVSDADRWFRTRYFKVESCRVVYR